MFFGSGKRVIRLSDPTSHGGMVVSAADNFSIMDKPVAREGDRCTCSIKGHNNCVIVGGDPSWRIDGRAVAIEGISKTSCGAELISTLGNLSRSYDGMGDAASLMSVSGGAAIGADVDRRPRDTPTYDEQVSLAVGAVSGQGVPFFIETSDGRVFSGYTDSKGTMPRIETDAEDTFQVFLYDAALARMENGNGGK